MGSGISGTIAAGTNGTILAVRYPEFYSSAGVLDPSAGKAWRLDRMYVHCTTIAAFGTLITAGRALRLVRAANANGPRVHAADPTGGIEFAFSANREGDTETLAKGYIANTGALTMSAFTVSTNVRKRFSLVHAGAAGSMYDEIWRWDGTEAKPLYLFPGQAACLVTEAAGAAGALDAGGTIQIHVDIDATEVEFSEIEL
jgi:hypothetical protein